MKITGVDPLSSLAVVPNCQHKGNNKSADQQQTAKESP